VLQFQAAKKSAAIPNRIAALFRHCYFFDQIEIDSFCITKP
jgi:hypothetical protein